jgi:hypothetical protein
LPRNSPLSRSTVDVSIGTTLPGRSNWPLILGYARTSWRWNAT